MQQKKRLVKAAETGNINELLQLVQERVDLSQPIEKGLTVMHIAAAAGQIDTMIFFNSDERVPVEQRQRFDVHSEDGWVPIFFAEYRRQRATMVFLNSDPRVPEKQRQPMDQYEQMLREKEALQEQVAELQEQVAELQEQVAELTSQVQKRPREEAVEGDNHVAFVKAIDPDAARAGLMLLGLAAVKKEKLDDEVDDAGVVNSTIPELKK